MPDRMKVESQLPNINDKSNPLEKHEQFFHPGAYRQNCLDLFKRLRYADSKYKFNPAIKEIPKELYNDFTQNGYMPLVKYWYFNEIFSDAFSDDKSKKQPVDNNVFNEYREKVRKSQPLGYGDRLLHEKMLNYKKQIDSKSIAIIGTITPWIEAISYELNASKITTLDYTRKYWTDPRLEWYHVNDYLEERLEKKEIEVHDNAATFSSIEHSGLGRFGDPLNPDGDIDAMKQVHCMIKPGGHFFLGDLQNLPQEKGQLSFNAGRVYGTKRLELLFVGWEVLEKKDNMFVLKKK